ncbi:hypothetical protein [Candidatus Hecatella orcuttiae]|uniref:hypothetical protein n=1 Tax=Candidatus Hecatella orcuttiae TaxID=1935119 RepID=UPI002867F08F|nr:hypothetical protein [Candidatus Hecatella orcuttiae]
MFEELGDEELKSRYLSLYEAVFVVECFGSHDVYELMALEDELARRGYRVRESLPEVVKVEEEEVEG